MADVPLLSNPMTAVGDLIVGGTSGAAGRLAAGAEGEVLKVGSGGVLEWAAESGGAGAAPISPILGTPSFSGAADKDFRDASVTLSPWTPDSGTEATINLHETTTTTKRYQRTAKGLLVQCGHSQELNFNATHTIADGESVVAALSYAPNVNAGDNGSIRLTLLNSGAGNWLTMMVEQDTAEYVVQGNSDNDSAGQEYTSVSMWLAPLVLFRISRAGLVYRGWASLDLGATWHYVWARTMASEAVTMRLAVQGASSGQTLIGVARFLFVKVGSNSYDPW